MSKRKAFTEACIYCGSSRPRRSREHVIPQALGAFENNWTLTCVCHECNQYFSRELELALAHDSAEAFLRLEHGIRPPADAAKLGKQRMKAWFKDSGPFQNVRIEFKPTRDGQVMEPVALAQLSYRLEGAEDWVSVSEEELSEHTIPRLSGTYEIRVTGPRERLPSLQAKMASLGIGFTITERLADQKLTDNKSIQVEHEFLVDITIARAAAKIIFNYAAYLLGAATLRHTMFDGLRRFIRHAEGDMSMVSVRRNPLVLELADRQLKGHGCAIGWHESRLLGIVAPFNEISYGVMLCDRPSSEWECNDRCHFFSLEDRAIVEVLATI